MLKQGIKICGHCKKEKTLDCFCKDCTTKDGYSSICKSCMSENRIKRKDKIDKWFEENDEYIKQYRKNYDKINSQKKKDYNNERKEYFKQKRKEYEIKNIDKVREQRRKQRTKVTTRYKKYIREAEERDLNFELSFDDFVYITSQPCFYCGEIQENEFGDKYSGIDRIDSTKGYFKGNVVPCCKMCNQMKMAIPLDIWLKKMNQIITHLNEINYKGEIK